MTIPLSEIKKNDSSALQRDQRRLWFASSFMCTPPVEPSRPGNPAARPMTTTAKFWVHDYSPLRFITFRPPKKRRTCSGGTHHEAGLDLNEVGGSVRAGAVLLFVVADGVDDRRAHEAARGQRQEPAGARGEA